MTSNLTAALEHGLRTAAEADCGNTIFEPREVWHSLAQRGLVAWDNLSEAWVLTTAGERVLFGN